MNARMEVPSQTKDAATTERGYIGQSAPRVGAKRLLEGRGAYIDDMRLPRLAHVVYVRSPHAHALIKSMDLSAVKKQPGVGHAIASAGVWLTFYIGRINIGQGAFALAGGYVYAILMTQ